MSDDMSQNIASFLILLIFFIILFAYSNNGFFNKVNEETGKREIYWAKTILFSFILSVIFALIYAMINRENDTLPELGGIQFYKPKNSPPPIPRRITPDIRYGNIILPEREERIPREYIEVPREYREVPREYNRGERIRREVDIANILPRERRNVTRGINYYESPLSDSPYRRRRRYY